MTLTDHIKHGTLVLGSLDSLYLCPDVECRTVSNISTECPVCGATHVLLLSTAVEGRLENGQECESQ